MKIYSEKGKTKDPSTIALWNVDGISVTPLFMLRYIVLCD